MAMWLCRAGKTGEYENKFLEDNKIYCTWDKLDKSLKDFKEKKDLISYLQLLYTDLKEKAAQSYANQIWAFSQKMKIGDIVVLPSKKGPVYHFAKILSDYEFVSSSSNFYLHIRNVEWIAKNVPKTLFDADIRNSLGAFSTICGIKQEDRALKVVNKFLSAKNLSEQIVDSDRNEEDEVDIEAAAIDKITEIIIHKFKGYEMQKIVEAILKAKGFTTYVSPVGPDKGVDILASAGELGFGSPKICVQVKSQESPVDRPTLDQLKGVMSNFNADYGLLVAWDGFKQSVIEATASQFFEIRLWTHKEVVSEFLKYYDKMDDEIHELVPLKKIWVYNVTEE